MPTKKEQITSKAIEILRNTPQGVRYSELVNQINESFPDIPNNTIQGTIWNLDTRKPTEVYKAARGLFRHTSFREAQVVSEEVVQPFSKINEEDFYRSFADYLENDLEEVTKAIPLGGNAFKDKWGTPDVIGIENQGHLT